MINHNSFKQLLESEKVEYIMEAHDAISGKIVEETGFKGIWASGLSISATLGFRDNNEASWMHVLNTVEQICSNNHIPVIVDADTGYGDFNNARIFAKKLVQRGASAMCIEDKVFPKKNSFINGESQELADINEFCGKITAIKDTVSHFDFSVIARVEAFIVGKGLEEALKRAKAYSDAGADAILMHSKKGTCEDIKQFMNAWKDECPVIVVPTTYYNTPKYEFEDMGVSVVIWANHLIRASIINMQKIAKLVLNESSVIGIEQEIASVKEIFRLQNVKELEAAEKKYLYN